MLTIRFLGAAQTVTGSCFLVENDTRGVLVDCGLVQGHTELTARNRLPFEFDPASLGAVIVTHAHLDHTGLVPRLVAQGFRGRILTTGITKELWLGDRKIVFSGDLGHRGKPILRDPTIIETADTLVLESTYGDRNHKALPDTISELGRVIRETQAAGGTVVLPVYAIGRSQDILYVIYQLTFSGVLDKPRVFLDSPMAIRAAEVYGRHIEAMKRLPILFENRGRTQTPRTSHSPRVWQPREASRGFAGLSC
ncbi:MAG TPA: MBL fold metallo-hydrolase [Nitrospira sp.]